MKQVKLIDFRGFAILSSAPLAPQLWRKPFSIYGFQSPLELGDLGGENLNS